MREVLVIRLSRQIVDVNAFAALVDIGDRCARAPLEALALMDAVICSAASIDECIFGRGCERYGVKTGIDFAEVASVWSAIHDGSFGVRWWELEFHFCKLFARLGEAGGLGIGNGSVVHFDELLCDARLVEKGCDGFGRGGVMKCSECGVVGKGCDVLFVYLVEIASEIFEVDVGAWIGGGVLKCAKSGVSVSVIVFAAACWRTKDTFLCGECTRCNVFRGLSV